MNLLIVAIFLTILPVSELRGGLPVALIYAFKNHISVFLIFSLIVLINIFLIFLIFFFLDYLHKSFLKNKIYRKLFERYVEKNRKKIERFKRKYKKSGFLALALFVGIPLPGSGAWTGVLIAWLLDLERKKSIVAISIGVLIAGLIILLLFLKIHSIL